MKKHIVIMMMSLLPATSFAQTIDYDVNGDGFVNMVDVTYVINHILGKTNPGDETNVYKVCPDDNHPHMIDLGIGVKWACCNVGATAPEEQGGYYAWGETEEKALYNEDTYEFFYKDQNGETHAKILCDIGGTPYDVARTKWGGEWRIPTRNEIIQLAQSCTHALETVNGVDGMRFTGPNGASIFLPFAGCKPSQFFDEENRPTTSDICGNNVALYYWTSTVSQDEFLAYFLSFENSTDNGKLGWGTSVENDALTWEENPLEYDVDRASGFSIRPVCYSGNAPTPLSLSRSQVNMLTGESASVGIESGSGHYRVSSSEEKIALATVDDATVTITGVQEGEAVVSVIDNVTKERLTISVDVDMPFCPDDHHPHMIDLGLSKKWACRNVGATTPEDVGEFYAWGETETKSEFTNQNYNVNIGDLSSICGTDYDVAKVKWGDKWQMPSAEDIDELFTNCEIHIGHYGNYDGEDEEFKGLGLIIKGPMGRRIFLPLSWIYNQGQVGDDEDTDEGDERWDGFYWSGTPAADSGEHAHGIGFSEMVGGTEPFTYLPAKSKRHKGWLVRPVTK